MHQEQKAQEFLEMERNNELLQKQEVELANAQKANKQKVHLYVKPQCHF